MQNCTLQPPRRQLPAGEPSSFQLLYRCKKNGTTRGAVSERRQWRKKRIEGSVSKGECQAAAKADDYYEQRTVPYSKQTKSFYALHETIKKGNGRRRSVEILFEFNKVL